MKKVPLVTIAAREEGARLAGSCWGRPWHWPMWPALSRTAARVCAGVGLVAMRQLMDAELTCRIGHKDAKLLAQSTTSHGTTTNRARPAIRLTGRSEFQPWNSQRSLVGEPEPVKDCETAVGDVPPRVDERPAAAPRCGVGGDTWARRRCAGDRATRSAGVLIAPAWC
ncbi:MAG: hypothetical protein LC799_24775 [Actinobacteria bacterium]|nr:hypothetical protein [Actinomycetota bacterium]